MLLMIIVLLAAVGAIFIGSIVCEIISDLLFIFMLLSVIRGEAIEDAWDLMRCLDKSSECLAGPSWYGALYRALRWFSLDSLITYLSRWWLMGMHGSMRIRQRLFFMGAVIQKRWAQFQERDHPRLDTKEPLGPGEQP